MNKKWLCHTKKHKKLLNDIELISTESRSFATGFLRSIDLYFKDVIVSIVLVLKENEDVTDVQKCSGAFLYALSHDVREFHVVD
jgi:hypothetical protein